DLPRQLADGGQDDVEAGVGGREQPARVAQLRGVVDEGVAEQIADPASGGADDGLWAAAVPRARVSGEAGVEVGAALGDEAGLDAHGAAAGALGDAEAGHAQVRGGAGLGVAADEGEAGGLALAADGDGTGDAALVEQRALTDHALVEAVAAGVEDDAQGGAALDGEADHHGEVAAAGEELLGAVEGVDVPDAGRGGGLGGLGALFADDVVARE